jgi:hypothetical protein
MIRKSGNRFSDKIMLKARSGAAGVNGRVIAPADLQFGHPHEDVQPIGRRRDAARRDHDRPVTAAWMTELTTLRPLPIRI